MSGNVSSVCPGTNQVAGIAWRASSDRIRGTPTRGPNSPCENLTGRVAAADRVGDRVVIERERDGQAGRIGHRGLQPGGTGGTDTHSTAPPARTSPGVASRIL